LFFGEELFGFADLGALEWRISVAILSNVEARTARVEM